MASVGELDGLSYVEEAYGRSEWRAHADALVKSELALMNTREMHDLMPATWEMSVSPMVQAEMDRIARAIPAAKLDMKRYTLVFPEGADEVAEGAAVKRAKIAVELSRFATINASLNTRFASQAWEGHLPNLQHHLSSVRADHDATIAEQHTVNADRRSSQLTFNSTIASLEIKFQERTSRCQQLQAAIERDQRALDRLS